MLKLVRQFAGKSAANSAVGDVNRFLSDVLVEVAAENYRQTMYEYMALTPENNSSRQLDLDPPLRANERVQSGLFATAISRASLRSRTEVRVDRADRAQTFDALNNVDADSDGTTATVEARHGRIDHLAWYGSRVIGLEMKMAGLNCNDPKLTSSIIARWSNVLDQAKTAQTCLRDRQKEDRIRYPNPISLGMMVLVARRAVSIEGVEALDESVEMMELDAINAVSRLTPKPTFVATYTFPLEFRKLVRRRRGREAPKDGMAMYTPFVLFIAKPSVNSNK